MTARGIVFQCGACRSLVSAHSVVADQPQDRAGLSCAVCGGITWLPFATGAAGAQVVDVQSPVPAPSLQLAASSTALAPFSAGPSTAMTTASFDEEQRARIIDRLRKLPPAGTAQQELSTSFDRLLGLWQSDAEHKALLNKASIAGELAFVGQRYRSILDEVPGEPQAKKAQTELLGLAMATMSREKDLGSQVRGGINKNVAAVVIAVVTVIICGALVFVVPRLLRPDAENESMPGRLDVPPGARPPVVEER